MILNTDAFPHSLAYDPTRDSIIVSCGQGCSVMEFNRRSGALVQRVAIGPYPANNTLGICAGLGAWWVADIAANGVWRIDPSAGTKAFIATGAAPRDVAVVGALVAVTESGPGTVSLIDPATNAIKLGSAIQLGAASLAYRMRYDGSRYLAVTLFSANAVAFIDSGPWTLAATVPVGTQPWGVDFGRPGDAFCGNCGGESVSKIDISSADPANWHVSASTVITGSTAPAPHDVCYLSAVNEVIVDCSGANALLRLDPETLEHLGQVSTQTDPAVLCRTPDGALWNTNALSNTIQRRRPIASWG